MVKRDVVAQKVARAASWLDDAEQRFAVSKDQFLENPDFRDVAIFRLFLSIQEAIDLAAHWIADDGLDPADEYALAFDVLRNHDRIDAALARAMKGATGLRNLIAHGYGSIDAGRIYDEAKVGIPEVRRFLDSVAKAAGF